MSARYPSAAAAFLLAASQAARAGAPVDESAFPTDTIQNEHIRMVLFAPDIDEGYYRGARFDWSGIIQRVDFEGHRIWGRFSDEANATHHDRVMGPVEEFGINAGPLDYALTPVGESCVKIGVGELIKATDDEYLFYRPYEIRDPAPWQVSREKDRITYTHEIFTPMGYSYSFTKTIELDPERAGFTIRHALRNMGWKAFETDHYNHGFFIVDDDEIGPNYEVEFLADVSLRKAQKLAEEGARLDGRTLRFDRVLKDIWSEVDGPMTADNNGYVARHRPSGVSMSVKGDRPLCRFNVWANHRALCPEPFIPVRLEPGESMEWKTEFHFAKD